MIVSILNSTLSTQVGTAKIFSGPVNKEPVKFFEIFFIHPFKQELIIQVKGHQIHLKHHQKIARVLLSYKRFIKFP